MGVHVIFLRRAISGVHEVECGRSDAIELPSLPMTINRVDAQTNRHSWPSVEAAILLRLLSPNMLILPVSHLCKNVTCTLGICSA